MFLELHIIQSFAPACLNRDDTNAPKSCDFGGFRRARISSQCIKRAIRTYFAQHAAALGLTGALASRSKQLLAQLVRRAEKDGLSDAAPVLKFALESAGLKMEDERTSVLLFLGADEIERLYGALRKCWNELVMVQAAQQVKNSQPASDSVKSGNSKSQKEQRRERKDLLPEAAERALKVLTQGTRAADIALFGRMIAELENMNVSAACQVAHALSTHEVDMEMDFFTAVDDLQPVGKTGAGMMGLVEFNSSCFYRYALLDSAQLLENLQGDEPLCRTAALAFLRASIYAIPSARQTGAAAQNLPLYVRATARKSGCPLSFANAFLSPVRPDRECDLARASIQRLESHQKDLARMYDDMPPAFDGASSIFEEHGKLSTRELLLQMAEVLA